METRTQTSANAPSARAMMRCLALALFFTVCAPAWAQDEGGSIGGSIAPSPSRKAPLPHRARPPRAAPAPSRRAVRAPPPERATRRAASRRGSVGGGGGGFDGTWAISAGGSCAAAGSNQVVISGTRISGQGINGSVSRNGAVRTVGSINGLTVLGSGHISGTSASGIYRQSDGCSGPWSGSKL